MHFDVSNLNKKNKLLKFISMQITKLFDLHEIAVQHYIQDISDIHPAVESKKTNFFG